MTAMPGDTIDVLLVAPQHIERSEFFSSFLEMLKGQKEVANVTVCFIGCLGTVCDKFVSRGAPYNNCLRVYMPEFLLFI